MAKEGSARKMRIAIIGGGLAGATLANALPDHPFLDVHIYESAPGFSERGIAIGLASNALQKCILAANMLLDRAGAVPINSMRAVILCSRNCNPPQG